MQMISVNKNQTHSSLLPFLYSTDHLQFRVFSTVVLSIWATGRTVPVRHVCHSTRQRGAPR